ncbi:MAG: epoxide hydrolase [Solirubrobacterales bacterium]|nr:epoxide hydrolase [Solirubrobacterales bacterium]
MKIATNGIELDVTLAGAGPLVVLCHGFPELAYSWRHQLPALVAAGYRVAAPDMRGFGGSSRPDHVDAYDVVTVGEDLVGLLDALGEEHAVFVGHDWGASAVWQLALSHAARVRAVAGLSVPFAARAPIPPVDIMRRRLGEDFYMVWFQEQGPADAALAANVRRTLLQEGDWTAEWAGRDDEPPVPSWLTPAELAVYVDAFEVTGFTGGLNYYRNIDRNWHVTAPNEGRRVEQPALFLTGADDLVRRFMPTADLRRWVPGLREALVVDGAGHWVNQERPAEVNAALLRFLAGVD